jgi:hypothetical protein
MSMQTIESTDKGTPFQQKVAMLAEITVFFGGPKVWKKWTFFLEGLALSHGVDQAEASACFFLAVASFGEQEFWNEA